MPFQEPQKNKYIHQIYQIYIERKAPLSDTMPVFLVESSCLSWFAHNILNFFLLFLFSEPGVVGQFYIIERQVMFACEPTEISPR